MHVKSIRTRNSRVAAMMVGAALLGVLAGAFGPSAGSVEGSTRPAGAAAPGDLAWG